jgi:hypothetical protein
MEQALDKKNTVNQEDLYNYEKSRWLQWEACK